MKKKLAISFFITFLLSFTWLSSLTISFADNDKKTGEFESVSDQTISGYAGEPGDGNGGGESVTYIDIDIKQNNTILKTIKVNSFDIEELQGLKHYKFNVDMHSQWPSNLNRNQDFDLVGNVYREVGTNIQYQYSFGKESIKLNDPLSNTPSVDFEVKPSKESGYIINPETGVALADLNASIIPKGVGGDAVRQTPIDVVFIFDTSGSMELNMSNSSSDKEKFAKAKEGAINAINKFKDSAITGDRFALIPFSINVGNVINFNSETSISGIDTKLDEIKSSINKLTADGGTNYYAALSKANELLGNSRNPKYVIFLTDGRPDTYENYTGLKISGEFPKWEKTTKAVEVKECFLFMCKRKTKSETVSEGWSAEKYPINEAYVTLNKSKNNNEITFNYDREKYLYGKGDLDYAYARATASDLASKGVKLYSIGFGSDGDVDMNFLNELSTLTGAFAQKGVKADISSIYENVTNTISKQALRNIKVMVNIKDPNFPGNVVLNDGAVIDEKDPNYAVVNFDDIHYEQGQTPNQTQTKSFSLAFVEPGTYSFNDVKLMYTDLANETKTIEGVPFEVKVLKNKDIGMKFLADVYEVDVDSKTVPSIDLTSEVVPLNVGGEIPNKLTWSSSNNAVATVNNGTLTPKGIGETQIKITAVDESGNPIEATTILKVNLVLSGIKFDATSYQYKGPIDMYGKIEFIYSTPENFKITLPSRNELQWGPGFSNILTINNGELARKEKVAGEQEPSGFELITAKLKTPNPNTDYYKIKPSAETEAKALMKVNGSSKVINEPKEQW
ncbi:VWA domain-containing protein [Schinkia sp. CFF1]